MGFVVFRVPPPEPDETAGTTKVKVDWSELRPKVPSEGAETAAGGVRVASYPCGCA